MSYPPNLLPRDYSHIHGDHLVDDDEIVSDCCGSEIIHTDICSECKEHCEPFEN